MNTRRIWGLFGAAAVAFFVAGVSCQGEADARFPGGGFNGSCSGGGASTITTSAPLSGNGSVGTPATIANGALTLPKLATQADQTFVGNVSGGAASPLALSVAQMKTALSLPNFGEDTTVAKANASAISKTIFESIASFSTSTNGAEVSQWLIKLLRGGTAQSSYLLTPNGLTTDFDGTTWTNTNKASGSTVSSIAYNSSGQLLLDATQSAGGVIIKNNAATIATFRSASGGGLTLGAVPLVESQWTNIASANDLTPGPTGSGGRITGTTQVNRISYALANYGQQIWIVTTSGLTFKHNQASSGNFMPIRLAGSVDFVAAANCMLVLTLVADNSGGGDPAWREVSRSCP